jgi:signal transduction histidine kinase
VVVLPLLGSVLLNILGRSEIERSQASQVLVQRYALVRSLSSAVEWNDLVEQVVEFPHFVLPVLNCGLYVYNEKTSEFELAGYWAQGEQAQEEEIAISVSRQEQQACLGEGFSQFLPTGPNAGSAPLYRLMLCLGGKTWGLLQMRLPPGAAPSESQQDILNAVSTDLALVLDRAMLRSNVISQAAASEAVRRQIAHDLHDTLAQNIAYLRLKLEELLLEENPGRQISLIRGDLRRMSDTADEAYTQVRDTLADLQSGESRDLLEILQNRAQAVGERAGLEVIVSQEGTPQPALDGLARRQAIYICREALTNIERHSRASRVNMTLSWEEDCLKISIQDDGIGFDPAAVDDRRHYGLMIMRERAESVGGELHIESTASQGTTVTLTVPLAGSAPKNGLFALHSDNVHASHGGGNGR